jgi:hypothetical protein
VTTEMLGEQRSARDGQTARSVRGRTPAGRQPDAMDPGFHCVRTHWIQGFMAFRLARRTRGVMLAVPV